MINVDSQFHPISTTVDGVLDGLEPSKGIPTLMTTNANMPGATNSGHVTDHTTTDSENTRADRIRSTLASAPFGEAPADEMTAWAESMCEAGLAMLLIAPGSKLPVDMRDAKQRRLDDEAAQDAAKQAGRRDWQKAKSLGGSHLATTDGPILGKYIIKYRKTFGEDVAVNFAVETGASRLVVIDADTADEVAAFLADSGIEGAFEPTVRSPGATDAAGAWVHKDGGHFYFTVPEGVELPRGSGTLKAPGGYAIM